MSIENLVSVTPFVPMDGIPHAGGEYVRRHLNTIAESFNVTIIAPENLANLRAKDRVSPQASQVMLIPAPREALHKLMRPLWIASKALKGASLGIHTEFKFKRDSQVLSALKDAKIVEFQWTEAATLSRFVRSVAPEARQVLIIHDVLTQRWKRSAQNSAKPSRKLFYYLRFLSAWRAERRAFSSVDAVIAFSAKDAQIVTQIHPATKVYVVDPPLVDDRMPQVKKRPSSEESSILFTGALNRPENHEAMMWFLKTVWPKTRQAVPHARVVVAGAQPQEELIKLAAQDERVELTGYVDDLDSYYESAHVFIAPLLRGAGVKFKTITALLWSLPVVTTKVGAEGIEGPDLFAAVTDDSEAFGRALIQELLNRDKYDDRVIRATNWARRNYGTEKFRRLLQTIYGSSAEGVSAES